MRTIDEIITEIINKYAQETDVIYEYKQINKYDPSKSLLPSNKYNVAIRSDDHWPPHLHITTSNGWDVAFYLSNGNVYKISSKGKKKQEYNFLIKAIPNWLQQKSIIDPSKTNQYMAISIWNEMHSNNQMDLPKIK